MKRGAPIFDLWTGDRLTREERDALILRMADSGEKYEEIGHRFDLTRQRVGQIVTASGRPPKEGTGGNGRNAVRGEDHPCWNGGVAYSTAGYRMVRKQDHHRADERGYVLEHILVAEEKLGRPIGTDEAVHHVNGVKDDNRPENLEVMDFAEHSRMHRREQLERAG